MDDVEVGLELDDEDVFEDETLGDEEEEEVD